MTDLARIARYEILNPIGQGGMGTLYLARDPAIDRLVAIKLLKEGLDSPELRERFTREARSAGRLHHPNIVTVFDVGDHDSRPFIAMEFVRGETLREMIRRGAPLALTRKLEIIEGVCQGLAYAHKSGIVHRDIKPANLMVDTDGVVKILDFGIARVDQSEFTRHGIIIGSLNYMSPEQMSGARIDHRTDVFALGAVLYELLSYRQAFPGGISDGILHRVMTQEPVPLTTLVPGLDPEIVGCVARTLRKDPDERYQDLNALRKDLARIRVRLEAEGGFEATVQLPTVRLGPDQTGAERSGRRTAERELLKQQRTQKIDELLATAHRAFSAGGYQDARAACVELLMIDPDHSAALELIERVENAETNERRKAALLTRAREALETGAITLASHLTAEAAALVPDAADVARLREAVSAAERQLQERRERERRLQSAIERARTSLASGELQEAMRAVDDALAIDADHSEAAVLKSQIQAAVEERRRREHDRRAQTTVEAARRAFAAGDHGFALERLQAFTPPHEAVGDALRELQAEAERIRRRTEALGKLADAQEALQARRFAEALHALQDAERLDPDTPGLGEARHEAETRHAEAQRDAERQRRMDQALSTAERCAKAGDSARALEALEALFALDPRHETGRALERTVKQAIARRTAERTASECVAGAQLLAARGEFEPAIQQLEAFQPPHPSIDEALAAIRARYEAELLRREQEEVRRREAAREQEERAQARRALDERAAAEKARAQQALADGRFDVAIEALNAAKAATPADQAIDRLIAEVRSAQAAAEAERKRLRAAEEKLDEARTHVARRDFARAVRLVDAVLLLTPDNSEAQALAQHCRTELEAGRRDAEERKAAERAIAQARRLLRKGRAEEAIRQLEAFVPAVRVSAALDELRTEWHLQQQQEAERARRRQEAGQQDAADPDLDEAQPTTARRRRIAYASAAGLVVAVAIGALLLTMFRSGPDPAPARTIDEIHASAEQLIGADRVLEAAQEIDRGLAAYPNDPRLIEMGHQLVTVAAEQTTAAADAAQRAGTEDRPEFGRGAAAAARARELTDGRQYADALRTYGEATSHYDAALKHAPPVAQIAELRRSGNDRGALEMLRTALDDRPDNPQLSALLEEMNADAAKRAADAAASVRRVAGFNAKSPPPPFQAVETRRTAALSAPVSTERIGQLLDIAEAYPPIGRNVQAGQLLSQGLAAARAGRHQEALKYLADAERRFPGHEATTNLAHEVTGAAEQAARNARTKAVGAGATAQNSAAFRDAEERERAAGAARGQSDRARAWLDAIDRFEKAIVEVRAAAAPPTPAPKTDAPGDIAGSKLPAPEPPRPTLDRQGVMQALDQYRAAYRKFDAVLMRDVFPDFPPERVKGMQDNKRACREYDVQFQGDPKLTLTADGSVLAETRTNYICKGAAGRGGDDVMVEAFTLRQRDDGRWLIVRTLREG